MKDINKQILVIEDNAIKTSYSFNNNIKIINKLDKSFEEIKLISDDN